MLVTHRGNEGVPVDIVKLTAPVAEVDEEAVEAELDAYIQGREVVVADAPKREPWRIETLGQADWAMRRYAEAQRADREFSDQIALWEAARRNAKRAVEFFDDLLKAWGIKSRTKDAKTFTLAHGTVATKSGQARIQITDADAVLVWAKKNAKSAIKVTEEVQVSKLDDVVIGELVVGYESVQTTVDPPNIERIALPAPIVFNQEQLDKVRGQLGEGFTVEPLFELFAVDKNGAPVPGMGVKPGAVTATVTPLGI